mmetsp:Transcript_1244/g.1745  ORF Transcript_1244/g.1745 Transcript_1244/m.1745 type:complete len:104 (+) Transcript_1244:287-598(+)
MQNATRIYQSVLWSTPAPPMTILTWNHRFPAAGGIRLAMGNAMQTAIRRGFPLMMGTVCSVPQGVHCLIWMTLFATLSAITLSVRMMKVTALEATEGSSTIGI